MNIADKISENYEIISQGNIKTRLIHELYFQIIQLKQLNPDLLNIYQTLYQDSKLFISFYIDTIDERDIGYDVINIKKIMECISLHEDFDENYRLSQFTYRLLKNKGFDEESKCLKKKVNCAKTKLLNNEKYFFGKYLKLILHLSTYNIGAILIVIVILFIITNIILLPSPFDSWGVFRVTYNDYSDFFLFNHFFNLLSFIFGVNNSFKVETNSILGILTLVVMKLFYLLFIINYLYKLLLDLIRGE